MLNVIFVKIKTSGAKLRRAKKIKTPFLSE